MRQPLPRRLMRVEAVVVSGVRDIVVQRQSGLRSRSRGVYVEQHHATPTHPNAHEFSDLTARRMTRCASVGLDLPRGSRPDLSRFYHNRLSSRSQVYDSKDGEMLERSIRHAWNRIWRRSPTHTETSLGASNSTTSCYRMLLDVKP